IWDWDSMQTPIVETLTIGGQKRDAVVHINKNAYYFVLDAATGKPLIPAPETPVPQDARAHTYPTQPVPQTTANALVPHLTPHPPGTPRVSPRRTGSRTSSPRRSTRRTQTRSM